MSGNPDLIDQLLSIVPDSHLDRVRRNRSSAKEQVQAAYKALFDPLDAAEVSLLERLVVATFVVRLHEQFGLADHYAHRLALTAGGPGLAETLDVEIDRGRANGPYGEYPPGSLSPENRAGLHFSVADDSRVTLGGRLAAALEHAHLLVFRPRDASTEALQRLLDAGWSVPGIVTLSQLVAFLAFQVRLVEGLAAIAAAPGAAISLPSSSHLSA